MSLTQDHNRRSASAWNDQGKGVFGFTEQHGHLLTTPHGRRAPSGAAGELPGASTEGIRPREQGWQLSVRSSDLSLVLWYPDSAPGCSLQVSQCPDARHC